MSDASLDAMANFLSLGLGNYAVDVAPDDREYAVYEALYKPCVQATSSASTCVGDAMQTMGAGMQDRHNNAENPAWPSRAVRCATSKGKAVTRLATEHS